MAVSSTILQIVNLTGQPLVPSGFSNPTGMDIWQFSNVGNQNFFNFPIVFETGKGDQNDTGDCTFTMPFSTPATPLSFSLQARSLSAGSRHYLSVMFNQSNPQNGWQQQLPNLAVGICSTNPIMNTFQPNEIVWYMAASLIGTTQNIGFMNDAYMGLALVGLALLGTPASIQASIQNGNTTFTQLQQLQTTLVAKITGG